MSDLIKHFSLDQNTLTREDLDITKELEPFSDEETEKVIAFLNHETNIYIYPLNPSPPKVDS